MTAVMAYMHEVLFRICGDDPDTDHSRQNAGGTFERKDNGCTEKPDETGTKDSSSAAGRSGSDRFHRRSTGG